MKLLYLSHGLRSVCTLSLCLIGHCAAPLLGASLDLNAEELRGETTEKKVLVLENRHFTKQMRPELGFSGGGFLNEAYTTTLSYGLRAALFPTEWWGAEFQYLKTQVTDSADRKALRKLKFYDLSDKTKITSPDVDINRISQVIDATGVFAPIYGKINLLGLAIVYADVYGTAGLSFLTTEKGNKTALTIGAGQRFYFYKSWSIRIDYKDRIFSESRKSLNKEVRRHSHGLDLGLSYFFR